MKFTASRLSDNNKMLPVEIHIDKYGVTVKTPGIFRSKNDTIEFNKITKVSVETPIVGFSTITFHTARSVVSAHGFKNQM